ncbi:MAG: discoidin domain-containing protein [Deltaproteobacteria bacterium]|nr:discoidin domain-containing protein [Deltaproteobacteria bacterium]
MGRTRWLSVLALLPAVALAGPPKASSELRDSEGERHPAALAFDGLLETGWAEGDDGAGEGSWVELSLDRPTEITSVSIWPGNLSQGKRSLKECGRPRALKVTVGEGDGAVEKIVVLEDLAEVGPTRVDVVLDAPVEARTVRVSVEQAFEGYVFNDTYLAEVAVNFAKGDPGKAAERLIAWAEGPAGVKAAAKNREEIIAKFETLSASELGDSEVLAGIMDQAADGAPYLRERVASLVPAGFRVHALPPDEVSVSALLKLKDANAIPALEMAATRLLGAEAAALSDKVDYFYAYQELIGGGDRNLPYWGQTGWEPGALRGFGEPLPLEVDRAGTLYIADLANHRVQRFSGEGRSLGSWGGQEPEVSNAWITGSRRWYVGGAAASERAGGFTLPVDVEVIPGKDADRFAVLDGKGRVQLLDDEGRPEISWSILGARPLDEGLGGQAYLELVKGNLAVIWRDQVTVFTQQGEEVGAFELADGTPSGAEALKNGKLLLLYGPEMILYSLDGFRHGRLNGDELGLGFEDWDLTLDEDGKLWAVTDNGMAVKYKKPGKVDLAIQFTDRSLEKPRIAVFDDIVYIVEGDHITRVDTLELLAGETAAP